MLQQTTWTSLLAQIIHYDNDVSSRITFTVEASSSRKKCRKHSISKLRSPRRYTKTFL